jgi:N-methylhydantoinase A
VPALAAQFSAFGAIASDVRSAVEQDIAPVPLAEALEAIDALATRLSGAARGQLPPGDRRVEVRRHVGLRFYRQVHRVDVPLPDRPLVPPDAGRLADEFRRRYERVVGPGSASAGTPVEAVAVSAEATMAAPLPAPVSRAAEPAPPVRHRAARFAGRHLPTPVYRWSELGIDQRVPGPAFIESEDTTVVVYPGLVARAGHDGHLRLAEAGSTAGAR